MKITRDLRKQINQAIRLNISGSSPLAEVGIRADRVGTLDSTVNTLLWGDWDDNPNVDLMYLRDLKEIDEVPGLPGRAMLDIYVTTGVRHNRELETNVYVAIVGDSVIAATSNDLESERIEKAARGESV